MKHVDSIAIVALLAVALATIYLTAPPSDAIGECCPAAEVHGGLMPQTGGPIEPEDPVGPPDAPVKVVVFYEAENPCHEFMLPQSRELASGYAPNVRLEFAPWHAPGTAERAQQLSVACLVCISISGPVPEGSQRPETVSFAGPTEIGAWDWDEVTAAVEARLSVAGVDPKPLEADGD
ncbi:MAG: hypothetical protein ACOCX2_05265 [Armatimonadota bacterium]